MRMRQSIADIERAFVEESAEDRERRERLYREAELRARRRHAEKTHKRGSLRFFLVLMTLLGTAVLVTILMFQALLWVMG